MFTASDGSNQTVTITINGASTTTPVAPPVVDDTNGPQSGTTPPMNELLDDIVTVATGTPAVPDETDPDASKVPARALDSSTPRDSVAGGNALLDTSLADPDNPPDQNQGISDRRSGSTDPEPLDDLTVLEFLISPRAEFIQEARVEAPNNDAGQGDGLRRATLEMREQMDEAAREDRTSERTADLVLRASGTTLSAGSLAWLLRGGSLFASALSSVPTWAGFDPLPVLAKTKKTPPGATDKSKNSSKGDNDEGEAGRILDAVSNAESARKNAGRQGTDS